MDRFLGAFPHRFLLALHPWLCPRHFSRGDEKFSRRGFAPLHPPSYGPVYRSEGIYL